MSTLKFDLIVIGAGPGGIEAALYAAKRNIKTAIISATKIGGRATWGSLIPSKVWLASAENAQSIINASTFGFQNKETPVLNMDVLRSRIKTQSSKAAQLYENRLVEANVDVFYGMAKVTGDKTVIIEKEGKETVVASAKHLIISSGSAPIFFPNIKPNKDHIIAPKIAPGIEKIPDSILIAGGGVTGTEFAFAFAALGSQVTIVQAQNQLLPRLDAAICQRYETHLREAFNINIIVDTKVSAMKQIGQKVVTTLDSGEVIESEYGFISIGRKADLSFLENPSDLLLTPDNMVQIDEYCRTSQKGIYAIGDLTGAPMTANKATMQARIAVSHILHGAESTLLPAHNIEAVYSEPPVASIGNMNEEEHAEFISKSLNQLVKPNIWNEAAGFLKIKIDTRSGLIKGAAGYGKNMPEIMAIIQTAMNNDIAYRDIYKIPFAHPTFSEILSF